MVLETWSEPVVPSDSAPTLTKRSRPPSTRPTSTSTSSSVTEVAVSVTPLLLMSGFGSVLNTSIPATMRVTMFATSGRVTGCGAFSGTVVPSSKKASPRSSTMASGEENAGAPVASTAVAYAAA